MHYTAGIQPDSHIEKRIFIGCLAVIRKTDMVLFQQIAADKFRPDGIDIVKSCYPRNGITS